MPNLSTMDCFAVRYSVQTRDLNVLGCGMDPRGAVGAGEATVGFVVAEDGAGVGIELEAAAEVHGEVCHDAARGGDVTFLDVGNGTFAAATGFDKVQ